VSAIKNMWGGLYSDVRAGKSNQHNYVEFRSGSYMGLTVRDYVTNEMLSWH
jgi:hypothetical protein